MYVYVYVYVYTYVDIYIYISSIIKKQGGSIVRGLNLTVKSNCGFEQQTSGCTIVNNLTITTIKNRDVSIKNGQKWMKPLVI